MDTNEDLKTQLMRQLFNSFRQVSPEKTTTGLSEKAEGLLEKAVEIWQGRKVLIRIKFYPTLNFSEILTFFQAHREQALPEGQD